MSPIIRTVPLCVLISGIDSLRLSNEASNEELEKDLGKIGEIRQTTIKYQPELIIGLTSPNWLVSLRAQGQPI